MFYRRSFLRQVAVNVEVAIMANDQLLIAGWVAGRLPRHCWLTPQYSGRTGPKQPLILQAERPDVSRHLFRRGLFFVQTRDFACILPAPRDFKGEDELMLCFKLGRSVLTLTVQLQGRPQAARAALLRGKVAPTNEPDRDWMRMVESIQALCLTDYRLSSSTAVGPLPNKPLVTIIVPLYGPSIFLAAQYAALANDAGCSSMEIIYVLDDPPRTKQVSRELVELFSLLGLPYRLLVNEQNIGYGPSINAGAAVANGTYLLLLNSDVLPCKTGWLEKLLPTMADPQIGCLGARLLFANGKIQHAGVDLMTSGTPPVTVRYQGQESEFPPALHSGPVDAVTGACLLIKKAVFEQVGGLDSGYVIGDFEDIDLCMRCQRLGLQNYYQADVTLWHFERQSFPLHALSTGRRWQYNMARFQGIWTKTGLW